ncbi:nuclear pore complex protein Nup50 isoform X2 [Oratosquilla oratoria]
MAKRGAAKRGANKELTHDNWNDEDEPEEMGCFRQASDDQLAGRRIKKARRRGVVGESPSMGVFKSFQGFSKKDAPSTATFSFLNSKTSGTTPPSFGLSTDNKKDDDSSTKPSGFSFLSASKNSSTFSSSVKTDTEKKDEEDLASVETPDDSPKTNGLSSSPPGTSNSGSKSTVYLANLKALNLAVLSWIQQHINKNPYVNLMPVFEDYKKHFGEVVSKYKPESESESDPESAKESDKMDVKEEPKESEEKPAPTTTNLFSTTSTVTSNSTEKVDKPAVFSFSPVKTVGEEKKPTITFGASTNSSLFTFGKTPSTTTGSSSLTFGNTTSGATTNFFGSSGEGTKTGFSFSSGSTSATTTPAAETQAEDQYEPPKDEVVQVKEDDAVYEKKCKLFYSKQGQYVEKGVGMLYLKPAPGEKTQLIIRADTNLGNILLNIILNSSIPAQRVGKNNVLIVCVPNPPIDLKASEPPGPTSMLIRVKTGDDADELHSKIEELKK